MAAAASPSASMGSSRGACGFGKNNGRGWGSNRLLVLRRRAPRRIVTRRFATTFPLSLPFTAFTSHDLITFPLSVTDSGPSESAISGGTGWRLGSGLMSVPEVAFMDTHTRETRFKRGIHIVMCTRSLGAHSSLLFGWHA
jgi:hypothetical protein